MTSPKLIAPFHIARSMTTTGLHKLGPQMGTRYDRLVDLLVAANGAPPRHEALAPYVEKVKQHAYKITDADVDALKAAGLDDDTIFHATTDAALRAGLERWRKGLAVLGDE